MIVRATMIVEGERSSESEDGLSLKLVDESEN
jgi:hypothetical protein